jgi:hypothetical protein
MVKTGLFSTFTLLLYRWQTGLRNEALAYDFGRLVW